MAIVQDTQQSCLQSNFPPTKSGVHQSSSAYKPLCLGDTVMIHITFFYNALAQIAGKYKSMNQQLSIELKAEGLCTQSSFIKSLNVVAASHLCEPA